MNKNIDRKKRPLLEFGPLLLFFVTNFGAGKFGYDGIFWATAVLVVATMVALGLSWHWDRYIPKLPLLGGIAVGIFSGLTIWFDDPIFIKIKPTIISGLLALGLLAGQIMRRNLLKGLLDKHVELTETGWYRLGWVWTAMFVVSAVANEIAWRNMSTDSWVTFKVFGLPLISMVFAMASVPIVMRHSPQSQ